MEFYCGKKPNNVKDLAKFRWYLFSKFQWEFKIYGNNYKTLIWCCANIARPNLPNPELYGWQKTEDGLSAVTIDVLHAPKAVIEMSVCHCKGSRKTKMYMQ